MPEKWLRLLYHRMHEHPLAQDILHADETTLQVLRELGRSAETTSYLWLYRTGRSGPPIILYNYRQTHGGEHPRNFERGNLYPKKIEYDETYKKQTGCELSRRRTKS